MKATLKVTGTMVLTDDDLFTVLKDYAEGHRQELTPIILNYIKKMYGYTPTKVQYPPKEKGLQNIAVIIDSDVDEGAKPLGYFKPAKIVNSAEGFKRTWTGLYAAIGEVIDQQRSRKKKFIGWEDLRAELLDMEDDAQKKLFVKNGEELPLGVIKHRMAQSQIDRQSKGQPNLKGVKVDKRNQGLSF
jgi:hypothetical protein